MRRKRAFPMLVRRRFRLPQLTYEEELMAQEIARKTGSPLAQVRQWLREKKYREMYE